MLGQMIRVFKSKYWYLRGIISKLSHFPFNPDTTLTLIQQERRGRSDCGKALVPVEVGWGGSARCSVIRSAHRRPPQALLCFEVGGSSFPLCGPPKLAGDFC